MGALVLAAALAFSSPGGALASYMLRAASVVLVAAASQQVVWYQDGASKDYDGMKASCDEQLCTYDQLCPGGGPNTEPVGGQQAGHDMWAPIIPGPGEGTQNWVQVGTRASGSVISTQQV